MIKNIILLCIAAVCVNQAMDDSNGMITAKEVNCIAIDPTDSAFGCAVAVESHNRQQSVKFHAPFMRTEDLSLLYREYTLQDIHGAATDGDTQALETILGQNPESVDLMTDELQYTPLHIAARHGREDVVKILLKYKANVEIKSQFGATPLHYAAKQYHDKIIALLLENKANVNVYDNNDNTPLHSAALNHDAPSIELLLGAGAVMSINQKGETPFDFANKTAALYQQGRLNAAQLPKNFNPAQAMSLLTKKS